MSLAHRKITPSSGTPEHDVLSDGMVRTNSNGNATQERIGDMLRRHREERGEDMYRIAEDLCIRPTYLHALEGSQYHALPADAYVIGFLRTYATYLGLDGKMAIDRYRMEMAGRRTKPALLMPEPLSQSKKPTTLLVAGSILLSLLVYGLWYALSAGSANREPLSPPVVVTEPAPQAALSSTVTVTAPSSTTLNGMDAPSTNTPRPDTGSQVAASSPKAITPPPHVLIRAVQPSWILVSDRQGRTLVDRVLKTGESYAVPDQQGLRLTTGNGNGLVLALDGVDMPRLSTEQGKIQRNISLDTDDLRSLSLPLAD